MRTYRRATPAATTAAPRSSFFHEFELAPLPVKAVTGDAVVTVAFEPDETDAVTLAKVVIGAWGCPYEI